MRTAFIESLLELAQADERLVLIVGDLGFSVIEPYMQRLPRQFVNAGVAEQNMTGLAAGMALSGKIAFTYSIANFPTLRCLEQIRNDVCYHQANVKIVSVGGGLCYGAMGITHHATEDLGIMRMLPGMVVIAPADPLEAREATRAVVEYDGPCYLRLGKAGEPSVHKSPIQFRIGKAICARRGNDLTLISTGGMLLTALRAAERLAAQAGLEARVLSMHTLKPLDEDAIRIAARETRAIVTVEEHSVIGGLGSAVADVLAESLTRKVPFKKFGIPPMLPVDIGSQTYLLARYGLTDEAIANQLESWMESRPGSSRVLVERVGHS